MSLAVPVLPGALLVQVSGFQVVFVTIPSDLFPLAVHLRNLFGHKAQHSDKLAVQFRAQWLGQTISRHLLTRHVVDLEHSFANSINHPLVPNIDTPGSC